jgi:hypothetical protein
MRKVSGEAPVSNLAKPKLAVRELCKLEVLSLVQASGPTRPENSASGDQQPGSEAKKRAGTIGFCICDG